MTALDTRATATAAYRNSPIIEPAAYKLARLAPHYDGLTFLTAMKNGELPPAPIADLVGFEPRDVERGRVTFTLRPDESHYNPIGMVHGGVTATLLDTVMGCALHTTLEQGVGYSTTDIQVRYLRPVTVQVGSLVAEGTLVHRGRRTAVAEARLYDEQLGRLYATATSTLLIVEP
jgi:uncharacterized protein (TIGR00369 family)